MKRRILFVDDEPRVLEGLRGRLRRHRAKWEMTFVTSGREALKVLGAEPFDVIVTDMRMPEMDGAALLTKVHDEFPSVARIVLSGHAEVECALRVVPVAHQYLNKPCDEGVLENVVERACSLKALLGDEAIRKLVGGIDKLPSLPRIYTQLTAAVRSEHTTMDELASILKQDMAICAKLLQIVNSAFFRLARSITRVEDAAKYLGFNTIRQIALAAEVFLHDTHGESPIPIEELQTHGMLVGQLASMFFDNNDQKETAFVVGLLHDIGKLVLVTELPHHVESVLKEMKSRRCAMHTAEAALKGVCHAEIGAYLLGLWGLPYPIIEAVANHHNPSRVESKEFCLLSALHVADALIQEEAPQAFCRSNGNCGRLDLDYIQALGLMDKLEGWRASAGRLLQETTV